MKKNLKFLYCVISVKNGVDSCLRYNTKCSLLYILPLAIRKAERACAISYSLEQCDTILLVI